MRPIPEIGSVILHRGDLSRTVEARASLEPAGHRCGQAWVAVPRLFIAGVPALAREFGQNFVILEREDKPGLAALFNQGFRAALEAGSDYVLLLDAACCLEKNALAPLLIALEAQRLAGAACPALVAEKSEEIFSCGGAVSPWTGAVRLRLKGAALDSGGLRHWAVAGFVPCQCAIFKREFLEDVGLFNEAYGSFAFDAELGLRAAREHWSAIAVPQSRARIEAGASSAKRSAAMICELARNPIWLQRALGVPVKRLLALVWQGAFAWPLFFISNLFRGRFRAAGAVVKGSFCGLFHGGYRDGRHCALPIYGRKAQVAVPAPSTFVMKYLL